MGVGGCDASKGGVGVRGIYYAEAAAIDAMAVLKDQCYAAFTVVMGCANGRGSFAGSEAVMVARCGSQQWHSKLRHQKRQQ